MVKDFEGDLSELLPSIKVIRNTPKSEDKCMHSKVYTYNKLVSKLEFLVKWNAIQINEADNIDKILEIWLYFWNEELIVARLVKHDLDLIVDFVVKMIVSVEKFESDALERLKDFFKLLSSDKRYSSAKNNSSSDSESNTPKLTDLIQQEIMNRKAHFVGIFQWEATKDLKSQVKNLSFADQVNFEYMCKLKNSLHTYYFNVNVETSIVIDEEFLWFKNRLKQLKDITWQVQRRIKATEKHITNKKKQGKSEVYPQVVKYVDFENLVVNENHFSPDGIVEKLNDPQIQFQVKAQEKDPKHDDFTDSSLTKTMNSVKDKNLDFKSDSNYKQNNDQSDQKQHDSPISDFVLLGEEDLKWAPKDRNFGKSEK